MASGVPVVAPASGGPLDLVEPERTGLLFAPDSRAQLRAAVARLVEDPETRVRWGAQARAAVEHRTWNAVNDQLLGHYQDVCRARVEYGAPVAVLPGPVLDAVPGPGAAAA
jgi:phosphatidylinositol alpha 1,6-mannosyltransferase